MPESPNNTAQAVHDVSIRNKSDPDWNIYLRKIKYSCPNGHVLEHPNKDNEQMIETSEFEVLCDADRHWRPLLDYNPFPNTPVMPKCIRKFIFLFSILFIFHEFTGT